MSTQEGIAGALSAEDIETALCTLAEIWDSGNTDNLSQRQRDVADRVFMLWTADEEEEERP